MCSIKRTSKQKRFLLTKLVADAVDLALENASVVDQFARLEGDSGHPRFEQLRALHIDEGEDKTTPFS